MGSPTRLDAYQVVGFQQLTSLGTATALTVPAKAKVAYLTAEAQHVRFRDDGTVPTAAVGQRLLTTATQPFLYQGDLVGVRFIEEVAGAKLNVTYLA